MKKAILIGNGFTSQLIKEYSDSNMKEKLLQSFSKEYFHINELFDVFRMSMPTYSSKDIYTYNGGLKCSDQLFPSEQLYPQPEKILYNDKIKKHVIDILKEMNFENHNELFDTYFIGYGLIFEVINKEINSIENLLKVVNMFGKIGIKNEAMETEIKQIANQIYYNDGKYGLENTTLSDYSKITQFVSDYDFVFTTNYDLILDDLCDYPKEVFHLHGGFNIEHRNLKTKKRLTNEDAYIVWGINGDEKYQELSPGWDYSNFRYDAIRYGQSLLADYFIGLGEHDYEEIHIFGFSGENDQHINKRIVDNKINRRIYFYCNPESINNYNFQCKTKELFEGTKAEIIFEPWTKMWERIKS